MEGTRANPHIWNVTDVKKTNSLHPIIMSEVTRKLVFYEKTRNNGTKTELFFPHKDQQLSKLLRAGVRRGIK